MDDPDLTGQSILIAEDEPVVAKSLVRLLKIWGAAIVGPARTLDGAMALAMGSSRIDAAIIDVNLSGGMAFPRGRCTGRARCAADLDDRL